MLSATMLALSSSAAWSQTLPIAHVGPDFAERGKADSIVRDLVERFRLPGVSVALARNDRLVYAAAMGWADRDKRVPMATTTRMRLASVSKTLTSLALMTLAERGRVSLDTVVFGPTGVLGTEYGEPVFGGEKATITVRQLMQHLEGGWSNERNDPIFDFYDLTQRALIVKTLRDRPLESRPGTAQAYSNFGYLVLGRVIERVTGQRYEDAVRALILQPSGASEMRIGAPRGARLAPDEAIYEGSGQDDPYWLRPDLMDSHGGWVANPLELLRVVDRFDGRGDVPDLLPPKRLHEMTTGDARFPGYALGWDVYRRDNWWHLGSMPGTASMVARTENGFNWVIITNGSSASSGFTTALEVSMWKVLEAVSVWPVGEPW
jgi:CubicO group peptidase (beta-lactamase class C family)